MLVSIQWQPQIDLTSSTPLTKQNQEIYNYSLHVATIRSLESQRNLASLKMLETISTKKFGLQENIKNNYEVSVQCKQAPGIWQPHNTLNWFPSPRSLCVCVCVNQSYECFFSRIVGLSWSIVTRVFFNYPYYYFELL